MGSKLCGGNFLGRFLRLGKVDGDVKSSVITLARPFKVAYYAVAAYVITVTGELVVIISCLFWRLGIKRVKLFCNKGRTRNKNTHELCVKKVACGNGVFNDALFGGKVKQEGEYGVKTFLVVCNNAVLIFIKSEQLKNAVSAVNLIALFNQAAAERVFHKKFDLFVYHYI